MGQRITRATLSAFAGLAAACSLLAPSSDALSGAYVEGTSAPADADAGDGATTEAVVSCPPGAKPCGGACVSTASPETGCAASSCAPCRYAHAQALCIGGSCAMGPCENGFASCNDEVADGCETDTRTTSRFCGSCSVSCVGQTPLCSDGTCVERCHAVKTTGAGARIRFANAGLDVGAGDFTLELWARRHTDFVSSGKTFIATNGDYWQNAAVVRATDTGVSCDIIGATWSTPGPVHVSASVAIDRAWHHIACARADGVLRLFVDGELVASAVSTHPLVALSPGIMASAHDTQAIPVFLGPTRVSKGARYTARFSPRWHWELDPSTVAQFLVTTAFDGAVFPNEASRDNPATVTGSVVAADEEAPCN